MADNYPELDIESDTSLIQPDLPQLRQDRHDRNRAFLQTISPGLTAMVMPQEQQCDDPSVEDNAVCIQKHWRGYQGRKLYVDKLYNKFMQDEEKQQEHVRHQIEEGELLVENHQLEVLLDDNRTTRRNADRRYIGKVIIIQRALRSYLERKSAPESPISSHTNGSHGDGDCNRSNSNQVTQGDSDVSSRNSNEDNYKSSEGDSHRNLNQNISTNFSESDTRDLHSDNESENTFINPLSALSLSGPNTDQNTNLNKTKENSCSESQNVVEKLPLESDEDSWRRQRKQSLLFQAQEFAKLKKVNAHVLPFNLHMHTGSDVSGEDCATTAGQIKGINMTETVTQSRENFVVEDGATPPSACQCDTSNSDKIINPFQTNGSVLIDSDANSDRTSVSNMKTDLHPLDRNPETKGGNLTDDTKGNNSNFQTKGSNQNSQTKGNKSNSPAKGSSSSSPTKGGNPKVDEELHAFDVYNIETTMPDMDWSSLEEKLKAASDEAKQIQEARRNDREEIRKKLAMGVDDDDCYDDQEDEDVGYKKPNLQSRLSSGLQICFMNESPGDTDSEGRSPRQHDLHDNIKMVTKDNDLVDSDNNLRTVVDLNQTSSSTQPTSSSPPRLKIEQGAESVAKNLKSRQEQLQDEAKMALAQAGSMAHMQLEIEKQLQKKSPMAEMVGIPGLGERRRKKLGVRKLQDMNLTSIQVLYNDLQTQIENLNEELVHLLMERDELHMEQDSMLVDIEDLTRRAEEIAEKKNSTSAKDGQLKDSKHKTSTSVKGKLPSR